MQHDKVESGQPVDDRETAWDMIMACLGTTDKTFDPHYHFVTEDDYRRFLALYSRTWFFGDVDVVTLDPPVYEVHSDAEDAEQEDDKDDQEEDKEEEEEQDKEEEEEEDDE